MSSRTQILLWARQRGCRFYDCGAIPLPHITKIYRCEGLEKQVTKVFLGGPCLKFELNDSKAVDCPHRSLSTTWRTM